jgi:NTP pyrophosphatase (non-canonical NTP hydrolase)
MPVRFYKEQSLRDFQAIIDEIYGLTDDRLYSLWDLLTQQQRFSMRALKGIRKQNNKQIKINLIIAFCWTMTIANRLHIDLEDEVWRRFPNMCSYCGKAPCVCKKDKVSKRRKIKSSSTDRPENMQAMQEMFENIYPRKSRNIADAGIHFAEETGEVSESVQNYLGQHKSNLFGATKLELADYISCTFGVANSAKIDIAEELSKLFYKNCHVCHKAPCECTFTSIAKFAV